MAWLVKGETPSGTVCTAFSLPANNCYTGRMEETVWKSHVSKTLVRKPKPFRSCTIFSARTGVQQQGQAVPRAARVRPGGPQPCAG